MKSLNPKTSIERLQFFCTDDFAPVISGKKECIIEVQSEAKSLRLYFALYFASLILIMEVANKKNIPWDKYEIGIGFLVNLLHVKPYISKPNCKIQNWVDFAKVLMATDIFKPYHEIGPSNVRT